MNRCSVGRSVKGSRRVAGAQFDLQVDRPRNLEFQLFLVFFGLGGDGMV